MADVLSQTTTIDNLVSTFYSKKLLNRLIAQSRFYQFAEKTALPKGEGKTVTWNAWNNLTPASAALTEGTNNSLVAISARKVTATIAEYGRGVKPTELVELTAITSVVSGAVDVLSDCAKRTLDKVVQMGVFKASLAGNDGNTVLSAYMSSVASAFCAVTGTMADSNRQFSLPVIFGTSCARLSAVSKTAPSLSSRASVYAIRKTVNKLRALDAVPMDDGSYVGIAHPHFFATLMRDSAWATWNQYTQAKETMYKHEVGNIHKVRFLDSTDVPRYAAAAHSVNLTVIFGKQAFGCVEIEGGGARIIVKRPNQYDTSNPFDMYSTVAFKLINVGKALNPSAGRILLTHELI